MWVVTGRVEHVKIPRTGSDQPAASQPTWHSPGKQHRTRADRSSTGRSTSDFARRPTGPCVHRGQRSAHARFFSGGLC